MKTAVSRVSSLVIAGMLAACGGGGEGDDGDGNGNPGGGGSGGNTLPVLRIADARADESAGSARFELTLSAAAANAVTVDYSSSAGTATAEDFVTTSGSLSIPAGATTASLSVPLIDDTCHEPEEAFTLTLTSLSANATLGNGSAVGTIVSDDTPILLTLADATMVEGNAGEAMLTFTVTADRAECRDVTATFATNAITATAGEDFRETTNTFLLPAGETTGTIAVIVIGDTRVEIDEALSLNLANLSDNATATRADAIGVIENDDFPRLSVIGADLVEGNSGTRTLSFLVALEEPTSSPVSVNFITLDGTATTADNDYLPVGGTVTIPQGATQQEVEVQVVGDTRVEPNETFSAAVDTLVGDAVLFVDSATATIFDDDSSNTSPTEISARSASIGEGDSGTAQMRFAVDVTPAAEDPVSFDYATRDGTALAGADYTAASGRFTIPAGARTAELTVAVLGDTEQESDEEFVVELSNVSSNAILRTTQVTGRINDNDGSPALPRFSISDPNTVEGNSGTTPMQFVVTLSAAVAAPVSVDYATSDGTANSASGNDYVPASGTLTFAVGETQRLISVTINGDTVIEASETLRLTLSNVVGDAELIDTFGIGTIITDDFLPAVSIANAGSLEGNSGDLFELAFNVTMDRMASEDVTFQYATRNGTALSGEDYVPASGMAVIPAGSQATAVVVTLLGDNTPESDEQFFVDFTNVSINATLLVAQATGTILNEDNLLSGWQTPVALDTDPRDSRLPVVEMNRFGDAVALWRSSTLSFGMLFGRTFTPAAGWSAIAPVTTDGVDNFSFDVSINASGDTLAAWNSNGAKVRHFAPATGWAAPVTLDSTNVVLDRMSVDNNDSNEAAVITRNNYSGTPPPYKDMFASLYDPVGGTWGTPLTLLEFDNSATTTSDIAVDSSGNVFAVWSQSVVLVSRYSADTMLWSTPRTLTAESAPGIHRSGDYPNVAVDGDGNAFVSWYESTGAGATRANVVRYDVATDTWSTSPFVLNENSARRAYAPQLRVDNDGNALAIWMEDDGTGGSTPSYDIWSRRYDAVSGVWSPPTLVQDVNITLRIVASRFDTPMLAINDLGNALVVWSQSVAGSFIIRATTFADGEWSAPEEISDGTSTDASLPRVVMDTANRGLAVWQQVNPTTGDIEVWSSEYRLSAAP